MNSYLLAIGFSTLILSVSVQAVEPVSASHFADQVRPVLMQYCGECHAPDDPENDVNFLSALKNEDLPLQRTLWMSVVAQLRNRTMPPAKEDQPGEQDRLEIANWVETYLRATACSDGPYAGMVTPRRLNGHEFDNTVRDLIGLDLPFSDSFPVDGSGGEGFDNNGETLFLPPLLMERYLEVADNILNQAVITPTLNETLKPDDFSPKTIDQETGHISLATGKQITTLIQVHTTADYQVRVQAGNQSKQPSKLVLLVDGIAAHRFSLKAEKSSKSKKLGTHETMVRLSRGLHALSLQVLGKKSSVAIKELQLQENRGSITQTQQAIHDHVFDAGKNQQTINPRSAATEVIRNFAERAYRRPLANEELRKLMTLYDRAQRRGDPYEECVKLALKATLVSHHFLFRIEREPQQPGMQPLADHELATRLSYFLWSTMPDEELLRLADQGKLHKDKVLLAQVKRMIADEKAWAFAENFTGQWLGTRELGGSVRPVSNNFDGKYTAELAYDLREEPVRLMLHLLRKNQSLMELITADYTFVTERIAKHYGIKDVTGSHFRKVKITNGQRGGILKSGAVHLVTSFPNRTSPVLRGAWVLETLLGTPVPSPPPTVPEVDTKSKSAKTKTLREIFEKHRENPTCAACHNLMDPIGFGLENYDLIGRWRTEENGKKIDTSGQMPSGEKFSTPEELEQVILNRKEEFTRNLTEKMLGYALGRSLEDADQCTIEQIVEQLEQKNFNALEMINAIVLSTPFRNQQLPDNKD